MTRYGPPPERRFPYPPLLAYIQRHCGPNYNRKAVEAVGEGWSDSYIATLCGTNRCRVWQWRNRGVAAGVADRVAITLGAHPLEIWPDYLDDIDPDTVPELDEDAA
jgi:hypothetical protein